MSSSTSLARRSCAKTDVSASDEERLIAAVKALNEGGDVSDCVDVEAVIRYFVAHNFVCNFDSYTGSMVHNYYLYEAVSYTHLDVYKRQARKSARRSLRSAG